MTDKELNFIYRNHRGEVRPRRVIPESFHYGRTTYHSNKDQWFMIAFDLDKEKKRWFALEDIVAMGEEG